MLRKEDVADRRPSRPSVSVIMANYNGGAYIADAIKSVQMQTIPNVEIIVADDASTDRSVEITTDLMAHDVRIRLLRSDVNGGPANARNKALSVAQGEWIAVVDSDDLIHPSRFASLIELADRDRTDIVTDDVVEFYSDNSKPAHALLGSEAWKDPVWIDLITYIRLNHLYGSGPALGYLKPMVRARLLSEHKVRYDETLRNSEDFDLILQLLQKGSRMRIYPLPLYYYRRHPHSASYRLDKAALTSIRAATLRLLNEVPDADSSLFNALGARLRSIDTAIAYDNLLLSLKTGNWRASLYLALIRPKATALLRLPIYRRLRKVLPILGCEIL